MSNSFNDVLSVADSISIALDPRNTHGSYRASITCGASTLSTRYAPEKGEGVLAAFVKTLNLSMSDIDQHADGAPGEFAERLQQVRIFEIDTSKEFQFPNLPFDGTDSETLFKNARSVNWAWNQLIVDEKPVTELTCSVSLGAVTESVSITPEGPRMANMVSTLVTCLNNLLKRITLVKGEIRPKLNSGGVMTTSEELLNQALSIDYSFVEQRDRSFAVMCSVDLLFWGRGRSVAVVGNRTEAMAEALEECLVALSFDFAEAAAGTEMAISEILKTRKAAEEA